MASSFDDLPFEIILLILQLVACSNFKDVFSFRECCKVFYQAFLDPFFQKTVLVESPLTIKWGNQGFENFVSKFFHAGNPDVMTEVAFEIFFDCGTLESLHIALTQLEHVAKIGHFDAICA